MNNIMRITKYDVYIEYIESLWQIKSNNHIFALRIYTEIIENIHKEIMIDKVSKIDLFISFDVYISFSLEIIQKKHNDVFIE